MSPADWWRRLRKPLPDWWPQAARLDGRALAGDRWVVLDTETSGLSPWRDRLLSLAAVSIEAGSLPVAGQWYATLDNAGAGGVGDSVLIHRLTPGLLAGGMSLAEGVETLARFVGDAPVLAFHHGHDRDFLRTALNRAGHPMLPWRWWEAADVLRLAWPDAPAELATLDDWLCWQRVPVDERHHAREDAWATAMLLLKALPRLDAQGIRTRAGLARALRDLRGLRRYASA